MSSELPELPERFARPYARILELLCDPAGFDETAGAVLREAAEAAGFASAAIRVRDIGGLPLVASLGDIDKGRPGPHPCGPADGDAAGACICAAVAAGRIDAELPFFTKGGSFWTDSWTKTASSPEAAVRGLRAECTGGGDESVGIFPLRHRREIVGLLRVGDRRPGRFESGALAFLERVAFASGGPAGAARCRRDLLRLQGEFEEERRGAAGMVVMSEMASSLAHDLKNPLASMMLSANRLQRLTRGSEKIEPLADHLCTAIKTLGETVTRLTDAFGSPRTRPEPMEINRAIEDALFLVAPRAAGQNVRVIRALAEGLPGVSADAGFLKRALLNVLANALDAMPSGGTLRVESRLAADGQVEAVVADSGPGVPPEVADRLFKPFTTTRPDAAGLGLSVVRRIMELHRGSAQLEAGADGGARAVLRLPPAPAGRAGYGG